MRDRALRACLDFGGFVCSAIVPGLLLWALTRKNVP